MRILFYTSSIIQCLVCLDLAIVLLHQGRHVAGGCGLGKNLTSNLINKPRQLSLYSLNILLLPSIHLSIYLKLQFIVISVT